MSEQSEIEKAADIIAEAIQNRDVPTDFDVRTEAATTIAGAIRAIAHGDVSGPGGIEGLTMALSGEGDPSDPCVAGSLLRIAESIESLADSVDGVARALEEK